jgi:hypothetical protein
MRFRTRGRTKSRALIEACEPRRLLIAVPVTVDPTDRLSGSRVLGAWDAGTLDGWTVANAESSDVADGAITITSAASGVAQPQLDLRNIVSGPDLNFAYFDYLQLRVNVPAGFDRDLQFSFGTSTNPAFLATREFEIPASNLIADGQFHTYRADLGLVVYWRDALKDFRLQPFGTTVTTGESIAIDYVEVGDIPGDVLQFNTNINYAAGVTAATMQKIESKHFAVLWDPNVNPDGIVFNTATHGLRALRMFEECWQVYTKVLGFKEPSQNVNTGAGTRYKLNLSTWYSGYWAGVWNNYAHMNVGTSGLLDEGPGNPVPHELGHAFDMAQGGALAGGHWESHANYMRDARNVWFAPLLGPNTEFSAVELWPLVYSNYVQDDGRLIYNDFRVYMALQSYGEQFGLDATIASKLWITAPKDKTVYEKLAQILSSTFSVKDVAGEVLRYWPMLDMANRASMRAKLWTNAAERADYEYRTGSMLTPSPDKVNTYYVPLERAPEKYAYMFHELLPTAGSSSVTVNLRGMDVLGTDEDWRWSFAAVGPNDAIRYSDVWAPGEHTFNLQAGETRVLLIVVATPGNTTLDLESKANTKPFDKDTARLRYPYEVEVSGAVPVTKPLAYTAASYRTHANGGGLVALTATVAATAYVGPNARVLGTAVVTASARIEDYAVVAGTAKVRGNAGVSGYAVVYGNATVEGNAKIRDHAQVADNAYVGGNAVVQDYARMAESSRAIDSAIVRGDAYPFGAGTLSGTVIADYDYSMYFNIANGVVNDHVPYGDYYNDYNYQTQTKPRGLIASYRTEETAGELLWDEFGTQHAILRGSPTRADDVSFNSRVLQFNGATQYALLDRSLADQTDSAYSLWVNPSSTTENQALLYFGSSASTFLNLTARNTNGFAQLTISVNGTTQTLVSTQQVPANAWTHLAVTFGTGSVTMYINGVAAGTTAAMSFRPTSVLGANDYKSAEPLYLGRDVSGNFFAGKLEDVRFYNVAMTASEVASEYVRAGATIGRAFGTTPKTFDGTTTMMQSGVRNGSTRTLSAWIKPLSSDNVSTYEPIVDATDEIDAGRYGSGIGIDAGVFKVKLDGLGFWTTTVPVTLSQWQHVSVSFNGASARLYVNGVLRASRSYIANLNSLAGKNYRIGFTQASTDVTTRSFFHGQIFDLQIADRYLVPALGNGAPFAVADTMAVPVNSPATTLSVLANDMFSGTVNNGLTITSVTQPRRGSVAILAGGTGLSYTPDANKAGLDTFSYTIGDGFGRTSTATVSMSVLTTVVSTMFDYETVPNTLSISLVHEVSGGSYGLGALTIESLSGQATIIAENYFYDDATRTATFELPVGLADGDYRATFAAGNVLGLSTSLDFYVLAGDANRSRSVDFADLVLLAQHYGQTTGMTYADGDFDDDGDVDFADLVVLAQAYNVTLPAPAAAALPAAGVTAAPVPLTRGRPRKSVGSIIV